MIFIIFIFWGFLEGQVFAEASELPSHFRTTHDSYRKDRSIEIKGSLPTRQGLSELRVSGSSQFYEDGFNQILAYLIEAYHVQPNQLVIVDLREEPHHFAREKEVVESKGATIFRIPVTDHRKPENQQVDQFLAILSQLPKDAWLHFHCHAGLGRTTTFMSLYDMIKNPSLSLHDILERQFLIGGHNLESFEESVGSERYQWDVERNVFLHKFYEYVHASDGLKHSSWTDWVQRHYPQERGQHVSPLH